MADISACSGVGCNLAHKCYRHLCKKSDYQSYFANPPVNRDDRNKCDYFWKV